MLRYTLLVTTVLLASACTTPEQRATNMQAEMAQMMQIYGPACQRIGYAPNTDQWRGCVLQLAAKEDIERYGNYHYSLGYSRSRWGFGGMWGPYW
jgi:hypothetical protein